MKTIDLASGAVSAAELFEMARKDALLVKTAAGDSLMISPADEFTTEVELLRRNHSFMTMLDDFKNEKGVLPLDQVEKDLRG